MCYSCLCLSLAPTFYFRCVPFPIFLCRHSLPLIQMWHCGGRIARIPSAGPVLADASRGCRRHLPRRLFAPNYTSPGDIRLSYYSMVSDSKKKRLEAKAAKAAAEGKPIARVKSAASLKKNASVADSLASQMEEGTCLLLFDAFFPRSVFRFVPRVVCAGGGGRRTGSEAGTRLARVMLGNLAAADCRGRCEPDSHMIAEPATDEYAELGLNDRATTGVLTSHPQSRDIHFEQFTLLFHGHELLQDTNLELNYGRRYGLLGPNGCGKSTLLKALGAREIPIPEHIDIYFLDREMAASDLTALEAVMEVDSERAALEKEAEQLMTKEGPEVEARMEDIYERLDALDSDMAEVRAASILHGLGFDKEMQAKKTRDFSGGWRMRISLARALFVEPTFLVLDEPTNHLDLEACVWLEDTLKKWKRILLLVSHSQDFLNGVCTNIINIHQKKLHYYTGTLRICA